MLKAKAISSRGSFPQRPPGSFSRQGKFAKSNTEAARKSRRLYLAKKKAEFKKAAPLQKMMPFTPRLSDSVTCGRTVVSFRLTVYPFYPKAGQTFVAHCGHSPIAGKYRCIRRIKCTMRRARDHYWQKIGMPSPAAYEDLMRDILNMKTLPLDTKGVLYIFERIE